MKFETNKTSEIGILVGVTLRVKSFIDRFYPKITPDDLLTHARAMLRDFALRILPVVNEQGKLEGIVLREHVLALSSTKSNALVHDVMDTPRMVFKPEEDAVRAFKAMIELDEWYVPVVNESTGKYLGVISLEAYLRDVLRKEHPADNIKVSEIMSEDVEFFTPEDLVSKVWRKMVQLKYSGFPVVRGKERLVVGMITQHDLLKKGYTRIELESESGPRYGPKVKEAMTSPAITVRVWDRLKDTAALMIKHDIGRLPVVNDKGSLVGIVDRSDACSAYFKRF